MCILLVSQALEDLHHGVSDRVDHFVVMVVEGHLNIQTHKLGQVTVRVGVFRPENWNDADLIRVSKQSKLRWRGSNERFLLISGNKVSFPLYSKFLNLDGSQNRSPYKGSSSLQPGFWITAT